MLTIILSEQKKYGQVIELQNESWKKCDCKLVRRFHLNQHLPIKNRIIFVMNSLLDNG